MSRREEPLRVALAGCGAVGGALLHLLASGAEVGGRRVQVTRVLVRRPEAPRRVAPRPELLTTDLAEFLAAPADVVVEAIGGLETAGRIAEHVLARGGRLVTANKALLAARGSRLAALAQQSGGWLGFEAAVGGGVPVVRALRSSLAGLPIRSIRGILNGTANFVLTRLEGGASLAAALAEARRRGLAEADPSRDLDGRDVAEKLAILAWVAWGIPPEELAVEREGLLPDPEGLVQEAIAQGARLRLVGQCTLEAGRIAARVHPELVAAESSFGQTRDEQNRVAITLGWSAPVELAGPGAGGAPTAGALWSDIQVAGVAA